MTKVIPFILVMVFFFIPIAIASTKLGNFLDIPYSYQWLIIVPTFFASMFFIIVWSVLLKIKGGD